MIDDLRHLPPSEGQDAFDLGFSRDQCVMLLCVILTIAYILKDYL